MNEEDINKLPSIQNDNEGMPNHYRTENKLNYILDAGKPALVRCKEHFYAQLNAFRSIEAKFARQQGLPPQMQGEKYNKVCDMLERSKDFYEVEALAQLVFDQNVIPEEQEWQEKTAQVRALGKMWLPSRDRSYAFLKGNKQK